MMLRTNAPHLGWFWRGIGTARGPAVHACDREGGYSAGLHVTGAALAAGSRERTGEYPVIAIEHALSLIQPWIIAYGALALLVVIYFESFGAPLPAESALIAASVLAARGDLSIVAVAGAAWAGAILGDSTGYLIGRIGGWPLLMRFGPRIGFKAESLEHVADQVRRHGCMIVLTARFIPILQQLNGLIAGAVKMPVMQFGPANIVAGGLWAATWALGPYLLQTGFGLSSTR
jgi:membrane protein DedA with SNARE-associated domain